MNQRKYLYPQQAQQIPNGKNFLIIFKLIKIANPNPNPYANVRTPQQNLYPQPNVYQGNYNYNMPPSAIPQQNTLYPQPQNFTPNKNITQSPYLTNYSKSILNPNQNQQ